MKTKFNLIRVVAFLLVLAATFAVASNASAASSSFSATQSVANVTTGLNTAATTTTVANVAQVKASTTLTIASLPASGSIITIGGCAIEASSTDQTNCTGGTARIATTTSEDGVIGNARTATEFATAMQGLTNVKNTTASSTPAGNITVSASSTSATSVGFSTAAATTETGGNILFTSTSGVVTQSSAPSIKVLGVAPVAMKETITIGGTVSYDDVIALNSLALHTTYTVLSSDSNSSVADAINTLIQADENYDAADYFTSAVADNVITLTAKTTGTAFTAATSTVTNRAAVAQTVVFTPSDITAGETFTITINGNEYSYTAVSDNTATQVSSNLVTALSTNSAVNCSLVGATVSCVAVSPGTAFTYNATVAAQSRSGGSSSGSSSSGGGGGSSNRAVTPVVNIPFVVTPAGFTPPGIAYIFSGRLSQGSNGASVFALQNRLQREGFLTATPTGYFGPATFVALKAFQKSHGIDPLGVVGPATRAELNKSDTPVGSTLTAEARATLIQQITAQIQNLLAQIKALQAAGAQ